MNKPFRPARRKERLEVQGGAISLRPKEAPAGQSSTKRKAYRAEYERRKRAEEKELDGMWRA
jgi:hypothetical protein